MTYRVVIAGYSQMFASIIQGVIESGNQVVGVFRHEKVSVSPAKLFLKDYFAPSPDYSYIKQLNLHEIKARSVNSKDFQQELKKLKTDILLIASWGEKLKKTVINTPKIACINVHPALLPKYRGPNPYLQVIMHKETLTGVTFHLIDENYDSGDILLQYKIPILPDDTGKVLRAITAVVAKSGVIELLDRMENNQLESIAQNEDEASYYPQITLKDLMIDFSKNAADIYAQVRAICDWQSCYFLHNSQYFIVDKCRILLGDNVTEKAGTILSKENNNLTIVCGDNTLIELQHPKLYDKTLRPFTNLYLKCFVNVGDSLL